MPKIVDPFNSLTLLKTFPDATLRDLARNDCAKHDHRKAAVEILFFRRSPLIEHEDLRAFVIELKDEMDGINYVQPEHKEPESTFIPVTLTNGPLRASITTATMFGQEEVVDNGHGFTGFDSVQLMDKQAETISGAEAETVKTKRTRKKKETDAPE